MKLVEYLTNSFSREGIISEEDKEIVQFGLESLLGNLLGIVLILAIGICFGHIWEAILLWIFWFFLRKNAGGFHAETKLGCLLISMGMLILSFELFVVIEHTMGIYLLYSAITGFIIWVMTPVDNSKKQLDKVEYKVYQRRSRIILMVEEMIFGVGVYLGIKSIVKSIVMTFAIVSVSLLLGKIKRKGKMLRKVDLN